MRIQLNHALAFSLFRVTVTSYLTGRFYRLPMTKHSPFVMFKSVRTIEMKPFGNSVLFQFYFNLRGRFYKFSVINN